MNKFTIKKDVHVNKTIRLLEKNYNKLVKLSYKYDTSFNKIVEQCIEFALDNIKELEDEP